MEVNSFYISLSSPDLSSKYKIHHELTKVHSYIFRNFHIKISDYFVLQFLAEKINQTVSLKDILENHYSSDINMSRVLDLLYDKKYISRKQSELDRRMIEVAILQKGIDLLAKISLAENELLENYIRMKKTNILNIKINLKSEPETLEESKNSKKNKPFRLL
jgi:DNA-binding MarR family transcriptional regulator